MDTVPRSPVGRSKKKKLKRKKKKLASASHSGISNRRECNFSGTQLVVGHVDSFRKAHSDNRGRAPGHESHHESPEPSSVRRPEMDGLGMPYNAALDKAQFMQVIVASDL